MRVAHRGASGTAPEHTRSAFERAIELGADMIELDVQLSRDGELVVLHDFELERTTSGRGPVRDYAWQMLRELDAGTWFGAEFAGERVLRLDDVIDLVDGRARLNVEIKALPSDGQVVAEKVARLLTRRELIETTIVSCFDFDVLGAVRAQSPDLAIGLLTHEPDLSPIWEIARRLRAGTLHPYWAFATEEAVERAHREGLEVIAWTVNDVEAMDALVVCGVNGIISDYPERFDLVSATKPG